MQIFQMQIYVAKAAKDFFTNKTNCVAPLSKDFLAKKTFTISSKLVFLRHLILCMLGEGRRRSLRDSLVTHEDSWEDLI